MGPSGVGKTTVGERLSEESYWPFRDGDKFHSPENIRKMSSGTPLEDNDRMAWLDAMNAMLREHEAPQGTSDSCLLRPKTGLQGAAFTWNYRSLLDLSQGEL